MKLKEWITTVVPNGGRLIEVKRRSYSDIYFVEIALDNKNQIIEEEPYYLFWVPKKLPFSFPFSGRKDVHPQDREIKGIQMNLCWVAEGDFEWIRPVEGFW